jgi:hypothetical protein
MDGWEQSVDWRVSAGREAWAGTGQRLTAPNTEPSQLHDADSLQHPPVGHHCRYDSPVPVAMILKDGIGSKILIAGDFYTATLYAMGRKIFGKNTWFSD